MKPSFGGNQDDKDIKLPKRYYRYKQHVNL